MNDELPIAKLMEHAGLTREEAEEAMRGVRRGIADMEAGRFVKWSDLKRKYKDAP